jgi:hypothetical protein
MVKQVVQVEVAVMMEHLAAQLLVGQEPQIKDTQVAMHKTTTAVAAAVGQVQ